MDATFDFGGRVAIVTGGTRGIGFAIAEGFGQSNARVVITGRDEDGLAEARAALPESTLGVRADAADPAAPRRIVDAALEAFGRVDVLVNNAGLGQVVPSATVAAEDWQRVLDVNLGGVFRMAQAAGQEMLRQGSGAIVNVGSLTTFLGFPQRAAYAASKSAVAGLTRTLASEWGPSGVRVNCVVPGYIATAPVRRLIDQGTLDEARVCARTPLGRFGEPADLVGPVLFLASDAAGFVTGTTLAVDGGWLAYGYL